MDRRDIVQTFRSRLVSLIEDTGLTKSGFATRVGMDRSTLSQLLSAGNDRLPRAETIAAIAADQQVSVDWLLGLTTAGPVATDVMTQPTEIESGAGSPADERLLRWQADALGYKIRYIPSTLPDLLKSESLIRYEFKEYGRNVPELRIEHAEARRAYTRRPETDVECCSSVQAVEEFARGQGIWAGLSAGERRDQLALMSALCDELYPTFRWFLFDGLHRYSAPITIYGPRRVAIYVGNMYVVLTSNEHIRIFTQHFDGLIRDAVVQPPDVPELLKTLMEEIDNEQEACHGSG